MGSLTPRLGLFKVDPSIGASDAVDVDIDLDGNYDIIDDRASIRTRPTGIFPGASESYQGEMLYQTNGKIYQFQDTNTWKTLRQVPTTVKAQGLTQSVLNATPTILTWNAYTENRDGMNFQNDGNILFEKTGFYHLSATINWPGGAAGTRQFYLSIINPAAVTIRRFSVTRFTQLTWVTIDGFFLVTPALVNSKARIIAIQNTGATANITGNSNCFSATRIGGFGGD